MKRMEIENVLFKIGIPAGAKGLKCIADAIELIDKDPEIKMLKGLYCTIAEMNNTTAEKVERAIRHAFSVARAKGNVDVVEHYIGFIHNSNHDSLKMLYLKIRSEAEERFQKEKTHEIVVNWNGYKYIVIYGRYEHGWFIAIPNHEICINASDPSECLYNTEKLSCAIKSATAAREVAIAIKNDWENAEELNK